MIPKPENKRNLKPDLSLEYLTSWKKLFEEIDPKIRVYIYKGDHSEEDSVFKEVYERNVKNEASYWSSQFFNPRIFIQFQPRNGFRYDYLAGFENDFMFSNEELDTDIRAIHEHGIQECCPDTKKWAKFYKIICMDTERVRKKIPKPPK